MEGNVLVVYAILAILCGIIDGYHKIIPNLIVIPGIVVGCVITGNYLFMFVMLAIGTAMYEMEYWRGGDVKLLAMVGAFLGWYAFGVLIITCVFISIYKKWRVFSCGIPVAPVMALSSAPFVLINIPAIFQ